MSVLSAVILAATTVGVGIVAVLLLLSPGEIVSLVAGWERRNSRLPESLPYYLDIGRQSDSVQNSGPRRFLVYLDGIGKSAPRDTRKARELLHHLGEVLPGTRFVGHVIPYSPFNRALTLHPRVGRWWRLALRRFRVLVFLHNVAQTLVACDRRYQPAYHRAVAGTVLEHLRRSGYRPGSGIPIVLLGYSGGAAVAAGIAPLVASALRAPDLSVVSLGGVLDARSTLAGVDHLYHFRSRRDWVERLGVLVFPGRWRISRRSGWNVARRAGRVTIHELTGARHFGRRGYLSRIEIRRTLRAIAGVLVRPDDDRSESGRPDIGPSGRLDGDLVPESPGELRPSVRRSERDHDEPHGADRHGACTSSGRGSATYVSSE